MKFKLKERFRNINTNLKKHSTNIKTTGHIEHSQNQNHKQKMFKNVKTFLEIKIVSWDIIIKMQSCKWLHLQVHLHISTHMQELMI